VDVSAVADSLFREPWAARGMAIGDINNDGKLDAAVTTNDGPAYILHNETSTQNHWMMLKLVGHKSNRELQREAIFHPATNACILVWQEKPWLKA
jgi:hypothetical protein